MIETQHEIRSIFLHRPHPGLCPLNDKNTFLNIQNYNDSISKQEAKLSPHFYHSFSYFIVFPSFCLHYFLNTSTFHYNRLKNLSTEPCIWFPSVQTLSED
jgi:hypothetical protein